MQSAPQWTAGFARPSRSDGDLLWPGQASRDRRRSSRRAHRHRCRVRQKARNTCRDPRFSSSGRGVMPQHMRPLTRKGKSFDTQGVLMKMSGFGATELNSRLGQRPESSRSRRLPTINPFVGLANSSSRCFSDWAVTRHGLSKLSERICKYESWTESPRCWSHPRRRRCRPRSAPCNRWPMSLR